MSIASALEQLVDTMEHRGYSVRPYLRPGVSGMDIETALTPLGFTLPTQLVELYQWHDGIDTDKAQKQLFGDHNFLPLKAAMDAYDVILEDYADPSSLLELSLCFPISGFDGSYRLLYCHNEPFEGLEHPVIGVFHDISIAFESLEAMILTATEWFNSGVYDRRPVDENLKHSIRRRLNPRIPYRTTTY